MIGKSTVEVNKSRTSGFSSSKINWMLIGITAVALAVRLLSALYHGNGVDILPGIHDQVSYHGLAQRVVGGYGFSFGEMHWPITAADAPTAHWSFLYTLFLAGTYWLVGVEPLVVRLVQVVLVSIVHTCLVYRLGKEIFGRQTGVWAAALSAIYIYFVYYAGALMTEPFYIIGILWTLDVAIRLVRQANQYIIPLRVSSVSPAQRLGLWLELGLAISFTMLMRQVFGLFIPLLFLWLWWNISAAYRRGRQRVAAEMNNHRMSPQPFLGLHWPSLWGMALASFIALALIAPWTIRNYQAFGQLVPLNTNSGYAFFWGNHPIYGTNFVGILPADGPTYQELIPEELRSLNEAELDKALLRRGIEFVVNDPTRYIYLSISRTREYFKFWPSPASSLISNVARVGSFGIMLPFILYGLWLATRDCFRQIRQSVSDGITTPLQAEGSDNRILTNGVALLWLFMGFYTLIHLMTWALIRYRLPVDACLLIFAGYGICNLQRKWSLSSGAPAK